MRATIQQLLIPALYLANMVRQQSVTTQDDTNLMSSKITQSNAKFDIPGKRNKSIEAGLK